MPYAQIKPHIRTHIGQVNISVSTWYKQAVDLVTRTSIVVEGAPPFQCSTLTMNWLIYIYARNGPFRMI